VDSASVAGEKRRVRSWARGSGRRWASDRLPPSSSTGRFGHGVRDPRKLNDTVSEADLAFESSRGPRDHDKVDKAVEASSPDEPVFATCVKVYNDWESTQPKTSGRMRSTNYGSCYGAANRITARRYHATEGGSQSIATFVPSSGW
jgi:hypothetical protein